MRSRWFLVLFACLVWYTQSAYGRFPWVGSGGTPVVGGGGCGAVITPLSGCSLTTNSGTVTFANTQGPYGYDVLLNGVTNGIQATSLKVSFPGGLLIAKYDTALPADGPQSQCFQETTEIRNFTQPMAFFNPITCPGGM